MTRTGSPRRRIVTALAAATVLAVGCGGGESQPPSVRIALEADPATLDPALSVDVHSGRIIPLIAVGLVRYDRDLKLVGALAESWRTEDYGRAHRFTLRDDARFGDGTPVSAAAVKASFERLLDPELGSPRDWLFKRVVGADAFQRGDSAHVSGIEVVDERNLLIRLEDPFAPFLSFLAMPQAAVLPPSLIDAGAAAIGARLEGVGPWRLDSWTHDDKLVLTANPRFWDPPRARRLIVRIIPKPAMQMFDFEAARLDVVQVPESDIDRVRRSPPSGARLVTSNELAVNYIGLSNDFAPFRDVRVRRAMNMAVNVDALHEALGDGGVRAHGAIPPGLPGYDPARAPYPYAPDSARALLREAGLGEGFAFTILVREGSRFARSLLAVQSDLAKVGVEVSIGSREWGTMKETIDSGHAEAFLADWWADYPDAENFLFPLFHSRNIGGGGNRARLRNGDVDRAIDLAQAEGSPGRRDEIYRQVDALVHSQAPWIFLWHPVNLFLVRDTAGDYKPHPLFYGEDYTGLGADAAP